MECPPTSLASHFDADEPAGAVPFMVNARFTTRPLTGVDRVAAETIRALARVMPGGMLGAIPNHDPITPIDAMKLRRGRLNGHLWEQIELPTQVGRRWLYSPCNTGPVSLSRQIVVIHDAQFLTIGQTYSPLFRTWYRLLLPALARRARIVVTVSDFSKRELESYGVVPRGKAKVIHNGADHILRTPHDDSVLTRHGLRSNGYILAIAHLGVHKNLPMLLRAAAKRGPDALPIVVAGGVGNAKVFADGSPITVDGVRMIGRVTDAELRSLYTHATALAFPSRTEGFGLPPVEAMLCGCPVIASTGGALPEVCGSAALLLSPDDEEGWKNALIRIEADGTLRSSLREAGRRHAAKFTWDRAAGQLVQIVQEEILRERQVQPALKDIRAHSLHK